MKLLNKYACQCIDARYLFSQACVFIKLLGDVKGEPEKVQEAAQHLQGKE